MKISGMQARVYDRLVKPGDGCWLWPDVCLHHGKGVVRVDGRSVLVIKLIWGDLRGEVPQKLIPVLICGKSKCCNPDHVEWVTRSELNRRSLSGTLVCKKAGHPRTPANTYTFPGGKRTCRICREAGKRSDRAKMYGLTVDQLEAMEAASGGVCAICGKPPKPGSGLHVDHDHSTGGVRNLLCGACNKGLGFFRDDPCLLEAAVAYLRSVGRDCSGTAVPSDHELLQASGTRR
jgi:hypothetical protein